MAALSVIFGHSGGAIPHDEWRVCRVLIPAVIPAPRAAERCVPAVPGFPERGAVRLMAIACRSSSTPFSPTSTDCPRRTHDLACDRGVEFCHITELHIVDIVDIVDVGQVDQDLENAVIG